MKNKVWKEISKMIKKSKNEVVVIEPSLNNGEACIQDLRIGDQSAMAQVILNTSGIVVNRTIRILGQGNANITSITNLNGVSNGLPTKVEGFLMVATDIYGGLFAVNTAEANGPVGIVFYFAPDTLQWESLDFKYSEFLAWALSGNLAEFYSSFQWKTWAEDAKQVAFDQCILVYPYFWSKEIEIESASKKVVPFEELFNLNMDYKKKFDA